jgi:diguanylate cyclase (GGDEF)-like protein/PAS domain S-box-containing protein
MENRLEYLYKHILDSIYDGVYLVDMDRKILYWNNAAYRLTGYKPEEIVGKYCPDNILDHMDDAGNHLCFNGCPLVGTMEDGRFREQVVYLRQKNGERRSVTVRTTPLKDAKGEIIGAIEIFSAFKQDAAIVERLTRLQQELIVDHLTGVFNRKGLEKHLEQRIKEFKDNNWPFGVAFLDIDDFKAVNDTFGHPAGDGVLQLVANTLATAVRSFDTVGRWGGEEFVVILGDSCEDDIKKICNRHRVLIKDSYYTYKDYKIRFTASIGATIAKPEDTIESVIERADDLMYKSKVAGKNRVTFSAD